MMATSWDHLNGTSFPTNIFSVIGCCLYTGKSLPDNAGAIAGTNETTVSFNDNFYTDPNLPGGIAGGFDISNACLAHTITLGSGVTIYNAGTIYEHSGIATYNNVLYHKGVYYSGEGKNVTLKYTGSVPVGYDVQFSVNGETIEGSSFTMPAADVKVTVAGFLLKETFFLYGNLRSGYYWTTFYQGSFRYTLSEGAWAFTMGSDYQLYRLGADGRVIPAGVAVVIVSTSARINFFLSEDTATVTDHAPGGNILRGSDNAVPLTNGKVGEKIPYVLGVAGNPAVIGFYKYTGSEIPANKAYYEQ